MPRLDASLTQGLMNPTYSDRLAQAGGMLGGMGGQMRQTRQDKEKAQKMAGMTTEGLLSAQREAAATPAEAISAGLAQEKFGRETKERKDAERAKKQTQAERLAKSELSRMGIRHKALVKEGKTAEAAKLLTQMGEIAKGAMIEVGDFVEDVAPEKKDDSSRYLNIGGGKVFDTKTATMIGADGEEQDASLLDPKELATAIKSNQEAYTPVSWDNYSNKLADTGNPALAAKELEAVDTGKAMAEKRSAAVAKASGNIRIIDDLLEKDVNAWTQATLWWVPDGQPKTVANAVSTLESSLAFDTLQNMRDNSKTGGALGSISNQELVLLKNNLAALDPTDAEFKSRLRTIRKSYQRAVDIEQGPQGFDEEGNSLGSPNYVQGSNGQILYVDPITDIVYDYASGDPVEAEG